MRRSLRGSASPFLVLTKGHDSLWYRCLGGVFIAVPLPGVKKGLNKIRMSPQPGIPLWRLCDKCLTSAFGWVGWVLKLLTIILSFSLPSLERWSLGNYDPLLQDPWMPIDANRLLAILLAALVLAWPGLFPLGPCLALAGWWIH